MFSRFHSFIRNNRGQTLVEIALVLPILLLIISGIIEFGRVFNAYLTLTHSSREGARAGAVGKPDTEITEIVKTASYPLDSDNLTIQINPVESSRTRGSTITVEINSSVSIYTPFISSLIQNPFPVSGKTTMRVE